MKPAAFEYVRASTVAGAVAALAAGPDAKVLAGGQSLVPMMNMRLARPARLVDINAIAGLDAIAVAADGTLALGALVRHADLAASPLVGVRAPLLAAAARHVGHRAVRNRGTLGGSVAHADPAAELPAALLALDATLVAEGPRGRRRVAAGDFFRGLFTTALAPDELLVEIAVPDARAAGWGFAEVARRAGDFALAGVAALVRRDDGDAVGTRLVAFGAGDRPLRLAAAERALAVGHAMPEAIAAAAAAAARACAPADDVHASAEYRRHLVGVCAERALCEALARPAAADAR